MLFQGEEWGASAPFLYFTDHRDPALGEAVRQGRRHEFAAFGWSPEKIPDPQSPETFKKSVLDWSERETGSHVELLDWHRSLLALRRSVSALRDGRMEQISVRFDEDERWLLMERGAVVVAVNFSDTGRRIFLPGIAGARCALASERGVVADERGVFLPPESVAVFVHDIRSGI